MFDAQNGFKKGQAGVTEWRPIPKVLKDLLCRMVEKENEIKRVEKSVICIECSVRSRSSYPSFPPLLFLFVLFLLHLLIPPSSIPPPSPSLLLLAMSGSHNLPHFLFCKSLQSSPAWLPSFNNQQGL